MFEAHGDIGSPKNTGSAAYNGVSQEYTLTASGENMWAARDEFRFAWKRMSGDFILRARVRFIGDGVDPHRKLGWMVRQSLADDSPYADATVHGDGLTSLQYRRAKGGITGQVEAPITGPDVIQFEKRGSTYLFSSARFGDPFTTVRLDDLDLGGEDLYVGVFLCSHNPDVIEQAIFHNVRIIIPAREDFRPYRDYIGSVLETLDVETGERQVLYQSARPFEAPNWSPDGTALYYNTSGSDDSHRGCLIRFDLATRTRRVVDTDFATRLNNDHVLSFDGTMTGISDQTRGASAIYTLPTAGGSPRQMTVNTPSYLHGWSPDGRWLTYTGGRNGEYDIYKIASDGSGAEIRLTDHPGLDDGPEFSPDGGFIYFNSVRSGRMQLWRMRPDGGSLEQLTDDPFNNWFPHVSPDGKWIAFISFPGDVEPGDHPYYKQVYLRRMPADGGEARVIGYVYGGQGTINVPSWSPDSRMISFVSNTGGL
jgi:Tol biopolymer transport system component